MPVLCVAWLHLRTQALGLFTGIGYDAPATSQTCMETSDWCAVESWLTLAGLYLGSIFYAILISDISSIVVAMGVARQRFEASVSFGVG